LKSLWNLWIWLPAGVGVIVLAWPFDTAVDTALDVTNNAAWHNVAWWCSKIGEGGWIAAVGLTLAVVFFFLKRPRVASGIVFITLTSSLAGLAADVVRAICGRTRPTNHEVIQGFYGMWYNGHWIIGKYQFSSFPSGHSASAVGLAAAVWLCHRGWGMVAIVYALAVMWSRIALQCHHLSDVVASTVLSIPLAILLKHVLSPWVNAQMQAFYDRRNRRP
jgi:membrane-associated phospholipid phosphatase